MSPTLRPHIGWIALGLALTCAMQSPAQAAPEAVPAAGLTAAQVQTYRAGPGRQRWRDAAAQMAQLRQAPPSTALADLWRALDAGVNRPAGPHPLASATTAQSLPELEGKTAWLRGQVLGGQADGRYSYAYAFNLARLGRSHPLDRYGRAAQVAPGSDEAIVFEALRQARFSLWRVER